MKTFNLKFIFKFLILSLFCLKSHSYSKEHSKVLLISFDGFRHDYFDYADKVGIDLKYFKQIFKIGVKANHLKNVFITRTFPNHMSIITGCYEETHGIIDNIFYDPIFNETFSYKNLSQLLEPKWFSNNQPLWVTNMRNGHGSAVIYWPGQLSQFENTYPTHTFGIYNRNVSLNFKIDLILNWLFREDVTLGIVYHPEPDETGHIYGPNSKEILQKLIEIDNSIHYLINKIELHGLKSRLNVIIVSDHGMTDISNEKRIFIDNYVERHLYNQYHEESYPLWGLWPKSGIEILTIIEKLKSVPHVKVYQKDNIPKEWHYADNRRVAPIVLLADEGWSMVHNETDILTDKGSHGYSAQSNNMMGIFIAWGPDITINNSSDTVVRAVDIFPLIAQILQFDYTPHINGSLYNVKWLLRTTRNGAGIFTTLVIICILALITVLSACIFVSCAHYNANALHVQKVGNTYVLKSGNLVRKWQQNQNDINNDKNSKKSKYKQFLNKKSKITEADAAFLLESNDEDEILGDIPTSGYKFNS